MGPGIQGRERSGGGIGSRVLGMEQRGSGTGCRDGDIGSVMQEMGSEMQGLECRSSDSDGRG